MIVSTKTGLLLFRRGGLAGLKAADARVMCGKMSTMAETFYNPEQKELMETTRKVIEAEVNPYVDEWEAAKAFPAHKVFKVGPRY